MKTSSTNPKKLKLQKNKRRLKRVVITLKNKPNQNKKVKIPKRLQPRLLMNQQKAKKSI